MEIKETKLCECGKTISKYAKRCKPCNAVHQTKSNHTSSTVSNQKIDKNIKPYMLVRRTSDELRVRSNHSSMSGGI